MNALYDLPVIVKECSTEFKHLLNVTNHQSTRDSSSSASSIQANTTQLVSAMASYKSPTVILATALVRLHNNITVQSMIVRALIDHGSEGTLVTENVVQALGLKRFSVSAEITGVGENSTNKWKHRTGFTLSSCIHPQFQMSVDTAFVLRSLTSPLPKMNIHLQNWSHIQGLELAGPTFTRSGRIDLLIGVDVIPQLMLSEVRKGAQDQPITQRTQLGWIVFGKTNQILSHAISIRCHQTNLESLVNKFFELEKIPETRQLTAEEQWCEDHFKRTHTRQSNGKYMVRLQFKTQFDSSQVLGKSRQIALDRFHMLERKFQKQPALHQQYSAVIQEYFDLNQIIEAASTEEQHRTQTPLGQVGFAACTLPHHAVLKEESTTTKLRVVAFFWRNEQDQIQEYCLTTVTFGTASAPYTAIRIMHQLAQDESVRYPLAQHVLQKEIYVDDVQSGHDTVDGAIKIREDLIAALQSAGMCLRKWASNHPDLLVNIAQEHMSNSTILEVDNHDSIKTLVARLYDPLGFIVPVITTAKAILKDVWSIYENAGTIISRDYQMSRQSKYLGG
ncbi:uncharacterized protein LOC122319869 [Drosophila ficusphila]|uniref:uncharacterized protein LOC122319869 n=1 Tax=Drosophila ficusphila TaxID=30025 RepID=UPI001C88EEDD|nr:uncharacterized protein LOC122319869 [Drosophila ficusphila]